MKLIRVKCKDASSKLIKKFVNNYGWNIYVFQCKYGEYKVTQFDENSINIALTKPLDISLPIGTLNQELATKSFKNIDAAKKYAEFFYEQKTHAKRPPTIVSVR